MVGGKEDWGTEEAFPRQWQCEDNHGSSLDVIWTHNGVWVERNSIVSKVGSWVRWFFLRGVVMVVAWVHGGSYGNVLFSYRK
ncbi:hypothetical protein RJT34_31995 [Clitoria ternatea]|uniref:Transmembrane protein n=1 Tax=Clitoria ternatea TaxID=43366 RepID=A0AAN9I8Z0_CLITE